jgi:hypothetical protein
VLRGGVEGLVEFGAEAADEGTSEKLVDADAFPLATLEGAAADIPAVEVQRHSPSPEFLDAYGIECAGNRLGKPGFLDGAEAVVSFETAVGAFLGAGHQRCNEIAVTVDGEKTGSLGRGTSLFRDKMPERRIISLQGRHFLFPWRIL